MDSLNTGRFLQDPKPQTLNQVVDAVLGGNPSISIAGGTASGLLALVPDVTDRAMHLRGREEKAKKALVASVDSAHGFKTRCRQVSIRISWCAKQIFGVCTRCVS